VKRGLYARAGVPEYWVVSIPHREVIVHRDLSHGTYRQVTKVSERDTVSVASAPEKSFRVALIFGCE
jgi:Uma2 family endonuclease